LILNNIGTLLVHQNSLTEAKTYFIQAIEIMQVLLGGTNTPHTITAKGLWSLAYVEKEQGDFEQARGHYELCLTMNLKLLGPSNPLTVKNQKILASLEKRRATIGHLPNNTNTPPSSPFVSPREVAETQNTPTQTTVVIASAAKPLSTNISAAQALANTGVQLSNSAPVQSDGFFAKTFKRLKSKSTSETDSDAKRKSLPMSESSDSSSTADSLDDGYLPYEVLARSSVKRETLDKLPKVVDISKREAYLNDDEFNKVLGVSKEEFYKMPKWKQVAKKQKAKLF